MTNVAVVTGGGRGIGAATARLLGQRGYDVAISYVSDETASHEVVRDIERGGHRALAVRADCGSEDDIVRLFEMVDRELGVLGALVNNAGVVGEACRVDALKGEVASRVAAVNVVGPMLCAREAVRRMSTMHGGAGGRIVNISSTATHRGSPGEWVHYAASKGALDVFTGGLAREVAAEGIRVNAVAPGLVESDLHTDAGMPDRIERMAATIPLGRGGLPREIAQTVAWLVCDAPDYLSGAIIPVSGAR